MMKIRNGIWAVILALVVTATGCGKKQTNKQIEQKTFVKVEQVEDSYGRSKLLFNGKIKEKSLTSLSFRVGGPLVKLNVKTGDYVESGQIIAEIDKRDYQLQVQSTKAQWKQLEGEYNRYKELYKKDKIPANSYEKIESGYLMAKTGYENAVNQLNDTELKAPYSGYVFEKFIENFQTVGAGQPIASVIDISQLEVVIAVPENQLSAIKDCNTSFLNVKNANIEKMPVSILSVSEKAKTDGLYEVKFRFENKSDLHISPGMTAEVTMNCNNEKEALNIPSSAIFSDGESTCVWVYASTTHTIAKRKIKLTAFGSGGRIEVVSGLTTGDTIIVAGVNSLIEGQEVQLIKNPSETNIGGLL